MKEDTARDPAGWLPQDEVSAGELVTDHLRDHLAMLPGAKHHKSWMRRSDAPDHVQIRDAAVLLLFGRGQKVRTRAGLREQARLDHLGVGDVDILLLQRSDSLRHHPGQVAFPGGGRDPEDATIIAAALREAQEETGVDPAGVEVIGTMESLYVPVSRFDVTPVVAWWHSPVNVRVMDAGESAKVYRVPVADLVAAANRGTFRHPSRTFATPAFDVGVLKIWGFTAGILDFALETLGWASDWDPDRPIHINV